MARRDREQGEAEFRTVAKMQERVPDAFGRDVYAGTSNVLVSSSSTPATYTNMGTVTTK